MTKYHALEISVKRRQLKCVIKKNTREETGKKKIYIKKNKNIKRKIKVRRGSKSNFKKNLIKQQTNL